MSQVINQAPSKETQQNAVTIAKSIQKPGQTKEQTKLIAQGIEKGISEYKKQQKVKARSRDKQRKQQLKTKDHLEGETSQITDTKSGVLTRSGAKNKQVNQSSNVNKFINNIILPWLLLVASWGGFVFYYLNTP